MISNYIMNPKRFAKKYIFEQEQEHEKKSKSLKEIYYSRFQRQESMNRDITYLGGASKKWND